MSLWQSNYYPYNGLGGKSLWKDTDVFREAAITFSKLGKYTPYPEGTPGFNEYWTKEKDKILNGLEIGNQSVSGLHYLYLNYCPIPTKESTNSYTFPKFLDLDADWFKQIDNCKRDKEHFVSLKVRQVGASLKAMIPILWNLHFHKKSMNYVGSYLADHGDKAWTMLQDYLDNLNEHTAFYKNRSPDTQKRIRMAYEVFDNGKKLTKGKLSEVRKVNFKDNPTKGVGGGTTLFDYQEPGVANNFLDTVAYLLPALKKGAITTGLFCAAGSVGDLDDCQGLKEIFTKPALYGFKEFENVWFDDAMPKTCGYFIPRFMYYEPFVDQYGNSIINDPSEDQINWLRNSEDWNILIKNKGLDIYCAMDYIAYNRNEMKKTSTSFYITEITQNCIKPSEAFLSRGRSRFPKDLLLAHKNRLILYGDYKYGYAIKTQNDNGKIIPSKPLHDKKHPFNDYPVKLSSQNGSEGVIWIYEPPVSDNTIENLYLQSTDSVDQDVAPTSDSLFVTYIFKNDPGTLKISQDNATDKHYFKNEIVASYIGRRDKVEECYDISLFLSQYYPGCKNLVENANIGIITHHINKNKEFVLQDEMDEIKGLIGDSKVKRRKGYHPTAEIIDHGDDLIVKYLLENIGNEYDAEGNMTREILGLERIKDLGLIEELLEYDGEKNADRVTAFRGCLLYKEATAKRKIKTTSDKNDPIAQAAKFAESLLNKNRNNKVWDQYMNKTVFRQHPR